MEIKRGDRVLARSAFGDELERRATTGVVRGRDFPVVWVCTEEEWQDAERSGTEPDAEPWPSEDVEPAPDRAIA